jgi:flagellar biosynthetic protein FliR
MSFLIFLTINGHHLLIKALVDSYKLAPIGKFTIDKNIAFFMADIVSKSFSIGFRLSIPVITTILLIDILMGVLSRTMPQMNVFVVGMPLKIVIGLVVVMVTLPLFGVISNNVFEEMFNSIYEFLRLLT